MHEVRACKLSERSTVLWVSPVQYDARNSVAVKASQWRKIGTRVVLYTLLVVDGESEFPPSWRAPRTYERVPPYSIVRRRVHLGLLLWLSNEQYVFSSSETAKNDVFSETENPKIERPRDTAGPPHGAAACAPPHRAPGNARDEKTPDPNPIVGIDRDPIPDLNPSPSALTLNRTQYIWLSFAPLSKTVGCIYTSGFDKIANPAL
ncbi:hypothetical protein EVAR_17420_1 [Eumeta japonica]|uniref:Uncharacterized protein n=1 Tax=Eumeta variegata TaxID=151549 RepID=A0A4C1V9L0_EUMVA|nr:hypothetical protein EVAR_17420_1 [Eumeta japonica]